MEGRGGEGREGKGRGGEDDRERGGERERDKARSVLNRHGGIGRKSLTMFI